MTLCRDCLEIVCECHLGPVAPLEHKPTVHLEKLPRVARTVRQVWPNLKDDDLYGKPGPGGYEGLIHTFGLQVLTQGHDDDYQGDSHYLFWDASKRRFGFLNFGWGSCSGCDAYEACSKVSDLEELRIELLRGIVWFDSWIEFISWFRSDARDREFYTDGSGWKDFCSSVEKMLS